MSEVAAQPPAIEWDVSGAFWDGAFLGGAGPGLDGSLATPVFAQARLGAGYASEPWFFHLGVLGSIGGLGGFTVGGAVEVSHFDGPFLELAAGYCRRERALLQATLGYTIFGVSYQHLVAGDAPAHALLAVLRLPIGMWWFMVGRQPPSTAQALASEPVVPAAAEAGPPPQTRLRAERARAQGDAARAAEDLPRAEASYSEALTLIDDPHTRIARSEVRAALGRLVAATEDLKAALAFVRDEGVWDDERVRVLSDRYLALFSRLPQLRLLPTDVGPALVISVDDRPAPGLPLGYDHPLDPGPHTVRIRRGGKTLLEREVEAHEGEIIRLSVPSAASEQGP